MQVVLEDTWVLHRIEPYREKLDEGHLAPSTLYESAAIAAGFIQYFETEMIRLMVKTKINNSASNQKPFLGRFGKSYNNQRLSQ